MIVAAKGVCRVCDQDEVKEWLHPREMQFGTREQFTYFRCAFCGCLQLDKIPSDLQRYYPSDYYSYQAPQDVPISFKEKIKRRYFYPLMVKHRLGWESVLGKILSRRGYSCPPTPDWLRFFPRPISFNAPILDVGCGIGLNLLMLRDCGFTNLSGVDPFISRSLTYDGGVRINKCDLEEVRGKFRVIMFHHVFEHLANPVATLKKALQLLSNDGQILIRTPLADSMAAQKYRENWAQLDAPRHIALQTRKSMDFIAQKLGLKINQIVYDSSEFQFWASEQYLLDIPLQASNSYGHNPSQSIFSPDQIKAFVEETKRLNEQKKGDQAAFVLEFI